MVIREIAFDEIDLQDEAFRISEDLSPPALLHSLREVGQLNPALLFQHKARMTIVCGFRRLRAMKRLGMPRVLTRILPEGSCEPVRAMRMALLDNLSHRQLHPLESARTLFKLQVDFRVLEGELVRDYLPLLGLSPAQNVLSSYIALHQIRPSLRQCFSEGRLTLASVEVLSGTPPAVQDQIAVLMGKIRLSASLQRKFLGLLKDLADSEGSGMDAPLRSPELIEISDDPLLSPFEKGDRIHRLLYRSRNPRLSQALDRFADRKKQLRIPGSIRISAHPFFEEPGLHVEFDAPDSERFRALAAALQEVAQSAELKELFDVK